MLQWPDLPAIEYHDHSITYQELNHRANQLAFDITRMAPDEAIIGISTSRSIEMVIGILAILKSGKAYLPLNPTYPNARLVELKDNAQLQYTLCSQTEEQFFKNLDLIPLTYESVNNQEVNNHSFPFFEERAYVLYTSGSTGKPKGVCLGHAALINLIQWQSTNSNAGIGTRTLQFAPLTFDASFEDIFSTLITGGTIVLIEEQWLIEPEKLLRFIDQHKINRIFLPFVALQFLTDTAIAQQSRRSIVCPPEATKSASNACLGHLVQNALDATPATGRVWIKSERFSGQVKVEVGDSGAGMSEEFVRTRLFRPFNTTKHNGMGIGTYESFQYIRELGGQISVLSQPGQGTTITVTLPLFEARHGSDLLRRDAP